MDLTYQEAIEFLYSREAFGWKLGLERIAEILRRLNDPQKAFQSIVVGGTNGKGSTAAMLESIFRQTSKRVGLFTSPHLYDVRERIRIDGQKVDADAFCAAINRLAPILVEYESTFFEAITALAFYSFRQAGVQIATLEVGLGGRLDATNVVTPEVSVITDIGWDHTQHLGNTLEEIAREKAGIIKPQRPCTIGRLKPVARSVVENICRERGSELIEADKICCVSRLAMAAHSSRFVCDCDLGLHAAIELPLGGAHQVANSLLASATACSFCRANGFPTEQQIVSGLAQVRWPGRFEKVSDDPCTLLDVAHNPGSIDRLCYNLKRYYGHTSILFVFGVLADKDYRSILRSIGRAAEQLFLLPIDHPRALAVEKLHDVCRSMGLSSTVMEDFPQAYRVAATRPVLHQTRTICVTGSHFVVAQTAGYDFKNQTAPLLRKNID